MEESLSKALDDAKWNGIVKGVKVGRWERLRHLLFVDDVLPFCFWFKMIS